MPNLNQGPLIKFQAGSQRLMATKGKYAVHGKEKRGLSPSSPRSIGQSQGRRTPKSSCSGSPDRDLSILSDKPIPNYLRPTISSRNELCKYGKKQESEDRKLNSRRSFDKPPSPSQVQKTPLTASSRERTLKPSSPSPKTATSPKLISERILKTPRNGTTQPLLANQKSIKKSPHSTIKKEPKVTNTTNSSSSTISNPDMEGAEEKREGSSLEQVKEEMLILEGEKEIHLETPPPQNPKAISLLDHESKNPEDEKPEPCESSNLSEEPMAPQIEEADQEKRDEQTDHEDEEHDIEDEEHNNHPEVVGKHSEESLANEVQDEVNVKEGEEGLTEKANILRKGKVAPITEDSGDENQPNKVEFREGKELGLEEEGDGESQRLKFKESEDVEVMEVANPEQENVVLKQRQDVQGKKESPAYNDVIEETASKLVGKRKSKVKALVGAFETVISLQEPEGQQSQQTDKAVDDETTLNESSSS